MRQHSRPTAIVVPLIAALLVASCTAAGDDGETPEPGGTRFEGTPEPTAVDPEEVSAQLLSAGEEALEPVAEAEGAVRVYDGTTGEAPAIAEILSVDRDARATRLVWRLSSRSGTIRLDPNTLRVDSGVDAQDVDLVDPQAQQRLKPYRYRDEINFAQCICSSVPIRLDERGQVLYGLYPPLGEGTSTVTVEIPGFPAIEDVPVSEGDSP